MNRLAIACIAVLLIAIISITGVSLTFYSNKGNLPSGKMQQYTYSVVHSYQHDTTAFTEGLAYSDGYIYESTGLYGNSTLRRVDLSTGAVLEETKLGSQYFGEGLTIVGNEIVQLTWQENTAFVYDKTTFALLGDFTYPTEGWGLTSNGTDLIMSDGSSNLYFLNPDTFQRVGQVQVREGNASVININELEYVNGDLYANIWQQQKIAIINLQTGQVKAWINLAGIQNMVGFNSEQVLNGIAYDSQNDRLFITGKQWPQLFEIKLIPKNT